jgi:hypothetical protein
MADSTHLPGTGGCLAPGRVRSYIGGLPYHGETKSALSCAEAENQAGVGTYPATSPNAACQRSRSCPDKLPLHPPQHSCTESNGPSIATQPPGITACHNPGTSTPGTFRPLPDTTECCIGCDKAASRTTSSRTHRPGSNPISPRACPRAASPGCPPPRRPQKQPAAGPGRPGRRHWGIATAQDGCTLHSAPHVKPRTAPQPRQYRPRSRMRLPTAAGSGPAL